MFFLWGLVANIIKSEKKMDELYLILSHEKGNAI